MDKKNPPLQMEDLIVELAGFEPASKHIRRKLSTCLFRN